MKALIFSTLLVTALFCVGIQDLDRPQVVIDANTKQLIRAMLPGKNGQVIVVTDYRDPQYLNALKKGNCDFVEVP
jgi:hypothetical protein